MTETQGDLAALSRFIFRAPNWYASLTFALLVAALAGVGAFTSSYPLEDAWQGVFFIGVPTVVASLLTTPVDGWLDGQLTYNRSSLLALCCELIVVALLAVASVIAVLTRLGQNFVFDVLIAALALVFALRLLVVLAVSRNSLLLAAIPASIQTVTAGVLLFVYSGTMRYLTVDVPLLNAYLSRPQSAPSRLLLVTPNDLLLLVGMSVLYALVAYGFVRTMDRPWRQSLGVSGLDFLRGFIGHIAEGTRELEDFFEQIGEDAIVPVTVLSFRRPGGAKRQRSDAERASGDSREPGEEKARFVLPMIHPGPMGEIGGGNLPQRVAETATGLAFPPHATAGHDFNLVTEREVDTLVDAAERAAANVEYDREATPGVRTAHGDASLLGQGFGDDGAFLVATFAPEFADDVEYAVGLAAAAEARRAGLDDVLLADAHNSNNGLQGDDLGHVVPGSPRSFHLIEGAGDLGARLADAERGPLSLGVAWDRTVWTPQEGIGPLGVRVAVTDVGGQRACYVLVDGNNMEPGLRGDLVDALVDAHGFAPDAVEIMTTDTHIVNTVKSENQVGDVIDQRELAALVRDLAGDAVDDLEPVEAGVATEHAEVTVFGNDRTETLASHANAVIALGSVLGAVVVAATVLVSALIFFLT
ncbi:putative membrane protein [Halarchaeum rubridurum]|uniref:Membrane protein n=1 Tax=Halarchaeum rubridurum TaxID=489911 RepID=A0A830G016_9EURY|nr:DUF2070 family protein [Halarchaeum rubridurum]MBP1955147.1 putative membrane protein [Halarchaeum rubridurum]GGM68563.1 membrane protein [Halarchaeum rubridurum]